MSDVTTHAEAVRAAIEDGMFERSSQEIYKAGFVALDALLEENATLRERVEQAEVDTERYVTVELRTKIEEQAALVETLRHKESSMDTMLRVTETERDEERALVVSLTEQRDEALGIREGHISAVQQVMRERATIVQLREAFAKAAIPIEVLAGQIAVKPYKELTPDFQEVIVATALSIRDALAAGVPSTPPDRPETGWHDENGREWEIVTGRALSALRYIEQRYGRLDGVGWDRVLAVSSPVQATGRGAFRARSRTVVDAIQFTGTGESCTAVIEFLGGVNADGHDWNSATNTGGMVETLRGVEEFMPGDWIVREPNTFAVYAPRIFEEMFEPFAAVSSPVQATEPGVEALREVVYANHEEVKDLVARMKPEMQAQYLSRSTLAVETLGALLAAVSVPPEAAEPDAAVTLTREEVGQAIDGVSMLVTSEGDERCGFTMDACQCMKRKGHEGLHGCAHGGWRAEAPKGEQGDDRG